MRRRRITLVITSCLVIAGCSAGGVVTAPSEDDSAQSPAATDPPSPAPDDGADDDESVVAADPTPAPTPAPTEDPTPVLPDEPTPPPGVGGEETGPLGDTELDLETDEGSVQIGRGDVPSSLDPSFPLPPDLVVQLATETEADLGFSGTTELTLEALDELYRSGLPAAGYEVVDVQEVEGVLLAFTFEGPSGVGQVAITQTPGGTGWTLVVAIGDGEGQEEDVPG